MSETVTTGKWYRFGHVGQAGLCRVGVAGEKDRTGRSETIEIGSFKNPADAMLAVQAKDALDTTGRTPRELAERVEQLESQVADLHKQLQTKIKPPRLSTEEIEAWRDRHDLGSISGADLQACFEDAQTLHLNR